MAPAHRSLPLGALALLAVLLAAPATHATAMSPAARIATLKLAPCRLQQPARLQSYAAECGDLQVPEDPEASGGRMIRLFVARVPAISRRKRADPLFVLAGGPGQAATELFASVAPLFARIGRDRDIVLVDQRGTGRSNRLGCDADRSLFDETPAQIERTVVRCRAVLDARADLRQYTTSRAVLDLDRVRAALQYDRIDLYGVSYGTRVAQQYARRFPQRARALILDGVVSPQLVLGPAIALDAETALEHILARCRDEPACSQAFGDPAQDYHALRTALAARSVMVRAPNPMTGLPQVLEFSDRHLAVVLRLSSYASEQAALLPLALHRAQSTGDFGALASIFLLAQHSLDDALALGVHNSVVCTEDIPYINAASINRTQLEATYMGAAQLEGLQTVCQHWPRGIMDPDLHAPLASRTPALLLSGTDDPVTPPVYATQAALGFADKLHIVMPGLGHSQLAAPCLERIMAQFIEAGTARGLDASCTKDVRPMPFFTSLAGPEP